MSPYASELASARLDALRTLIDAMTEAETPDEKRRCAVAIFNAPDPCELDDEIELVDDDDDGENDEEDTDDEEHDDEEPDDDETDDEESDNPSEPAPTPRMSDAVEKSRESRESAAPLTPQHPPAASAPAPSVASVPSASPYHAAARSLHSPSPSPAPTPFLTAPTTPASRLTATAGTPHSTPRAAPT